jgi:hypothetical protein
MPVFRREKEFIGGMVPSHREKRRTRRTGAAGHRGRVVPDRLTGLTGPAVASAEPRPASTAAGQDHSLVLTARRLGRAGRP